jgi:hypothetical protein
MPVADWAVQPPPDRPAVIVSRLECGSALAAKAPFRADFSALEA